MPNSASRDFIGELSLPDSGMIYLRGLTIRPTRSRRRISYNRSFRHTGAYRTGSRCCSRSIKEFRRRSKPLSTGCFPGQSAAAYLFLALAAAPARFGLIDLIARGYGTLTWYFLVIFALPILVWGVRVMVVGLRTCPLRKPERPRDGQGPILPHRCSERAGPAPFGAYFNAGEG